MASRKVELVINGIKALTPDERKELARVLSGSPINYESIAMEGLNESFNKANSVHTAPIGFGTCNCCGK